VQQTSHNWANPIFAFRKRRKTDHGPFLSSASTFAGRARIVLLFGLALFVVMPGFAARPT